MMCHALYSHFRLDITKNADNLSNTQLSEFQLKGCSDIDFDGIVNGLDPDSDGDLCPDAIEGGDNFTTSDIDANDRLTGGIDLTTGVPLLLSNDYSVGPSDNNFGSGGNYNSSRALVFDVMQDVLLETVRVYANGAGARRIVIKDSGGNEIFSKVVNLADGEQVVDLDFLIPTGSNYEFTATEDYTINLYRHSSGPSYPYTSSMTGKLRHLVKE